jgi:hypothetical protein
MSDKTNISKNSNQLIAWLVGLHPFPAFVTASFSSFGEVLHLVQHPDYFPEVFTTQELNDTLKLCVIEGK